MIMAEKCVEQVSCRDRSNMALMAVQTLNRVHILCEKKEFTNLSIEGCKPRTADIQYSEWMGRRTSSPSQRQALQLATYHRDIETLLHESSLTGYTTIIGKHLTREYWSYCWRLASISMHSSNSRCSSSVPIRIHYSTRTCQILVSV
jgi:hypothetical protein